MGGSSPSKKPSLDFTQKKKKDEEQVDLKSPTSVSMKNSFIIQNSDHSFDTYALALKRKKMQIGPGGGTIFGLSLETGQKGISR